MALGLHHKVGMVVLSMAAPNRLARIFLKPYPQPMNESLQARGAVEKIEFPTVGGLRCRGWWIRPEQGGEGPVVVLAHGWTSHAMRMAGLVPPLLEQGCQVMLYNARSHGDSDYYPVCSMAQFAEDMMMAAEFARRRAPSVRVVGHSMGAGAALVAAADGAPVDAVAALASPAHPVQASTDILRAYGVPADMIMRRVSTYVRNAIGRDFDDIAPERRIREITCPVFLAHGTADEVVPVAHFHRIVAAAGPNVQHFLLDGGNHDQVKTVPEAQERLYMFLQGLQQKNNFTAESPGCNWWEPVIPELY